jgi:hypothetical protein
MRTIIPAMKHFWKDLSVLGRTLFVLSNIIFFLVFMLLLISAIIEIQNRDHYRKVIQTNDTRLDNICRNEPRLCE